MASATEKALDKRKQKKRNRRARNRGTGEADAGDLGRKKERTPFDDHPSNVQTVVPGHLRMYYSTNGQRVHELTGTTAEPSSSRTQFANTSPRQGNNSLLIPPPYQPEEDRYVDKSIADNMLIFDVAEARFFHLTLQECRETETYI